MTGATGAYSSAAVLVALAIGVGRVIAGGRISAKSRMCRDAIIGSVEVVLRTEMKRQLV